MNTRRRIVAVTLGAGLALGAAAPAMAGGPGGCNRLFDKVDLNADGKITSTEVATFSKQHGKTLTSAQADAIVARFDTDQDGSVERTEAKSAKSRFLKRFKSYQRRS